MCGRVEHCSFCGCCSSTLVCLLSHLLTLSPPTYPQPEHLTVELPFETFLFFLPSEDLAQHLVCGSAQAIFVDWG